MATNDFWNSLAGVSGEIQVSAHSLHAALYDVFVSGSGAMTQAQGAALWALSGDALDEYNDLVDSIDTIDTLLALILTADIRRSRQLAVIDGIFDSAACGQQTDLIGNVYNDPAPYVDNGNLIEGVRNGEKLRLRAKGLVTAFGGQPQGTLAA